MIGWGIGRDPVFELAQGWSRAFVIGRRTGLSSGVTTDVWPGSMTTRPLPLAPKGMSVVSSGDDVLGGNGAQHVVVTFIDVNGDWRVSDLLPTNGATPVDVQYHPSTPLLTSGGAPRPIDGDSQPALIHRVQTVSVYDAAGATEAAPKVANNGTISVVDTATGLVVYDAILPMFGRSQTAAFHAPRGYVTKIHKMNTYVFKTGASASGVFDVCVNFGPGTATQRLGLSMLSNAPSVYTNDPAVTNVVPRADFCVAVTPDSNGVDVLVVLEFRLQPIV